MKAFVTSSGPTKRLLLSSSLFNSILEMLAIAIRQEDKTFVCRNLKVYVENPN